MCTCVQVRRKGKWDTHHAHPTVHGALPFCRYLYVFLDLTLVMQAPSVQPLILITLN